MKHNIPQNTLPIGATTGIKAHRLLKVASDGNAAYAQPGDIVVGVSGIYDTNPGGTISMAQHGYLLVEYAANATVGQALTLAADGKLTPTTPDQAMFVSMTETSANDIGSAIRVFAPAAT